MRTSNPQRATSGFTLVELIVVITILAILGTIGFLQLGWFNKSARDWARISDTAAISKGLDALVSAGSKLPAPTGNSLMLYAQTWGIIGYQGYAGQNVLNAIRFSSNWGKDPVDGSYFTYSTDANYSRYQLVSLVEDAWKVALDDVFVDQAYASLSDDYSGRTPFSRWGQLGVLLGTNSPDINRPWQEKYTSSFTGVNIQTYTGAVKALANNSYSIVNSTTGSLLSWLEMSYKGTIQLAMTACPTGWTQKWTLDSGPDPILLSGVQAKVCEGSSAAPIPAGTRVAMVSCPTGWTQKWVFDSVWPDPVLLWWVQGKACEASSNMAIPAPAQVAMNACPLGWLQKGTLDATGPDPIYFAGVQGKVCQQN